MEGTSGFILKLFVVCAFVCLACGQTCPSQKRTSAKFIISSQRNQTGHWISQVQIQHGAGNNTLTTNPWTVEVEHSTVSCNGVESVQLVATLTEPPLRAGPGYVLHPGVGYYKLHSERKNWHAAREICAQEGGHLAIINSEKESKVLRDIFAPVADKMKNDWAFIGFHDLYNEGQYLTIFDEPLKSTGFYRWWASNQPDNFRGFDGALPGENCGSMHTNGGLNDLHCHFTQTFICEQELW